MNWTTYVITPLHYAFQNSSIKLLKDSIHSLILPLCPYDTSISSCNCSRRIQSRVSEKQEDKRAFHLKFGHYQNRLRPAVTLFVAGPADSPLTRYLQVRSMPSLRRKKTPDLKKKRKKKNIDLVVNMIARSPYDDEVSKVGLGHELVVIVSAISQPSTTTSIYIYRRLRKS